MNLGDGKLTLDFDFGSAKVVQNNLGGLGCCDNPQNDPQNAGPQVIRYANIASGQIRLLTEELAYLFREAHDESYLRPYLNDAYESIDLVYNTASYRFDLVVSNTTEYQPWTNKYNGYGTTKTFANINVKAGTETTFQFALKFSCCLDDECEEYLCDEEPDANCFHSMHPRESFYNCDAMDKTVDVDGITMRLG